MAEWRIFASSRRRRDAREGFVGRRGVVGARVFRRVSASRALASSRLRACDRCSDETTVRTPSASRAARRSRARALWASSRDVVVEMSRLSWTRESEVFTPCPPGPDECEKRSVNSEAGIVTPLGSPGPGRTYRSSTTPVCLKEAPAAGADRVGDARVTHACGVEIGRAVWVLLTV